MAIYHLHVEPGSRLRGSSAVNHWKSLMCGGLHARERDAVLHVESMHLPEWCGGQAEAFWETADIYERLNGRLYLEVEFALPIELAPDDQVTLARRFCSLVSDRWNLPHTLAVHAGYGENPHAHMMLSERGNDGIPRLRELWFRQWNAADPQRGGARKVRDLSQRDWLINTRASWARIANEALAEAGEPVRIDHRSLKAQGIDRMPQVHLGMRAAEMESRGIETERGDWLLSVKVRNSEMAELGQKPGGSGESA